MAGCFGFVPEEHRKDRESVDLRVKCYGPVSSDSKIKDAYLNLQLKASSKHRPDGDSFSFQLSKKNYDDLREVELSVPKLLVILELPGDENEWLSVTPQQLILKKCAFWANLKEFPPLPEDQQSKTVTISRRNIFSPETLQTIMERIARREEIGNAI